ncbi:MAG TPA: DinB family protein [Anaerolineales bacterium]|nr:DinB family protein [Anaerolineales bacterium]HNO31293.1 DinB family protein [Anaerolineales bacterium]
MKIQDIHLIYEYNYWANGKILSAAANVSLEQFLAPAAFPYGDLRATLVHLVDAEYVWRGLFENDKFNEEINPEDFPDIPSITATFHQEEQAMRAYLNGLTDSDLEGHKIYINDAGELRDRVLWHCLYHVVNHGMQHRSEAAAMLTSFNASPGDLDFTLFLNEFKPG